MNLHLVGGFLGSGKTTAIISAARLLMASGKRVAIITNDQGKYLVDTAFFRAARRARRGSDRGLLLLPLR